MYYRQSPLVLIGILIVIIIAVNLLLSFGMPHVSFAPWVADAIVIAVVAYVVGTIVTRNRRRWRLRMPAFRRRPRMRVVQRDPSKAASDFIRQFEDRSKQ